MKAMDAARAKLLASHPGPNMENASTPIAAQPICAKNILYFCTTTVEEKQKKQKKSKKLNVIEL